MSVPKPTEQSIVNACLDLLKLRGAFAYRVNQGALKDGKRFVRFNRVEGISDIVGVLRGGRYASIEVKRPGLGKRSRPEPHQQAFLDRVAACGGLAACVTSVAELDAILTREGY